MTEDAQSVTGFVGQLGNVAFPRKIMADSETQILSLIAGDTNYLECLGFHSVKPRNVRGRSTSTNGRAILHQDADESFKCSQELRCAKEGLYMMEDSQSMTGFANQLGNVAFP